MDAQQHHSLLRATAAQADLGLNGLNGQDAPDRGYRRRVGGGFAARWAEMGSAPASKPRLVRFLRSRRMLSSTSGRTARAFVWGRRRALGRIPPAQLLDPLSGDVVVAGDLAFAASFNPPRSDDELPLRHGRPPTSVEVPTMSRDSCNYVLKPTQRRTLGRRTLGRRPPAHPMQRGRG